MCRESSYFLCVSTCKRPSSLGDSTTWHSCRPSRVFFRTTGQSCGSSPRTRPGGGWTHLWKRKVRTMRVAVTRGDLPGPLYLADLEVISQYDPAIEPVGQTFYVSRPILSEMAAALADVPAGLLGTVNMTSIA